MLTQVTNTDMHAETRRRMCTHTHGCTDAPQHFIHLDKCGRIGYSLNWWYLHSSIGWESNFTCLWCCQRPPAVWRHETEVQTPSSHLFLRSHTKQASQMASFCLYLKFLNEHSKATLRTVEISDSCTCPLTVSRASRRGQLVSNATLSLFSRFCFP